MRICERWRRRRSALGAGALLVGLLAAGCSDAGGDVEPTAEPPPAVPPPEATETAVPSESPTDFATEPESPAPGPTPWPEPTRPEAMERDDIEGAKAAAEYFMALYPYVFATGDLEIWNEMSHPECQFCKSVREDVTELHSVGGYGTGGEYLISGDVVLPPDEEYQHFRVGLEGVEAPSSSYSSSGELLNSARGGEIYYTLGVLNDGNWTIRGVAVEDVS